MSIKQSVICVLIHSHEKRREKLEVSLKWVLFSAGLEFLKILVLRLPLNTSNANTEYGRKSKQLYSLCVQFLVALIYIHFIVLILICFLLIISGIYDYATYCCSPSRTTPGVTLHRSNTEGKTLLQLLLKIGW